MSEKKELKPKKQENNTKKEVKSIIVKLKNPKI